MPKVSQEHFKMRRAEILNAARKVFTRKGFEPTTMQDVVKETGMSRGGVYQYFSSTEEMFIAIREESFQEFETYLTQLLDTHKSVWEGLKTYVSNYIEEAETENVSFGLVSYEYSVVAWRNETHRQVIFDQSQKAITMMADFLDEGVKRGEFNPIYPLKAVASFLFNVTDGLLLHHMIAGPSHESVYINEQVSGLIDYLKLALQVSD